MQQNSSKKLAIIGASYLQEPLVKKAKEMGLYTICFGWYGYNATWWFYSCIIVLYLTFPWLYKTYGKKSFDSHRFYSGLLFLAYSSDC